MSPEPGVDYVKVDTTPLYTEPTGSKAELHLLWGDRLTVGGEEAGDRVKARARGEEGWVERSALGGKPLLEVYVIDVRQGDGILIKTPNGRHVLIDAGLPRSKQDLGKNAVDFVDWKFFHDYDSETIALDRVLSSHSDLDHYGGLIDLLEVGESEELDCTGVRVEGIHHAGIGWWVDPEDGRWLGTHQETEAGDFFTQLVGDRPAIEAALAPGADPALQGEWAAFLRAALNARRSDDSPTPIRRLSSADGFLPGFEPGTEDEPAIKVLAPVQFDVGGDPALRRLGAEDSINTNGNSLVLRLDYGACRFLLTGDINREAEEALLADYADRTEEFRCDVAKAAHHGSADFSLPFLRAMEPAVTVISSGDCESYDHPNPRLLAASALAGRVEIDEEKLVSPLIYSTELARSVELEPGNEATGGRAIVARLIYGLVNVRTDGERILCATRDEAELKWRIAEVTARP
ncbi:MAG TPA: MBL fold metallo-hydrolase [Solirubrobacterales bacterium]